MERIYSINNLRRFENNSFIREYKSEDNKKTYKYGIITEEVLKCVDNFKRNGIMGSVGICVDVREHDAESCTLLLGILNHECYFYCSDLEAIKEIQCHLTASGVEYVISKNIQAIRRICNAVHGTFIILSQEYYIGKIKKSTDAEDFRNRNICYTIATSGSTGLPKMVHVPYECIEPNIKSLCSILQIKDIDVIFFGSPPTFDPFVVELFMALEKGATLLTTTRSMRLTPNTKLLQDVTILQTTPSLFRLFGTRLIRDVLQPTSALRSLLLGGESFPSHQEIQLWIPHNFQEGSKRIFNIYGITEVSCWSTIFEYHPYAEYDRRDVPLGKTLDNLTLLRIIDETDGSVLPATGCCKGELLIGSSKRRCFIPEYDKDHKAWSASDIIYRKTGDIVERNVRGNLFYIGRVDNCIKRLGKRVCLDALANKIEYLLKHKTICLWQDIHKKLILCLNWNKIQIYDKPHIQRLLKEHLDDFEQPDLLYCIDDLPLNKHGKVDRKELLKVIMSRRKKYSQSHLNIFHNFLVDVMGFTDESFSTRSRDDQKSKRMKCNLDSCFIEAGGTSFQALSLATEIGELMERPEEQRKLLEMFLSSESSLQQILEFLKNVTPRTKESKLTLLDGSPETCDASIQLLWRSDLKKCVDSSPSLFQETRVAVGSHSRVLLTLDSITGEEISRTVLADRVECPVVFVSPALAIVGCYDGMLYGFNFNNGSILWKLNASGMIKAKPLISNNLVIVASYAKDYNVRAFDLKTLRCVWFLKVGSKGIFSSPLLVGDNLVLFCSLDGSFALTETTRGSIKWIKKLESPIFSTAAQLKTHVDELIIAEVKGKVSVCSQDNGEQIEYFQADGNIFSGITLCQKTAQNTLILFGCHDGNVYCLDYKSVTKRLSLVWKFPVNAAVYSTPIIAFAGTVLACSTKGLIVLIDISEAKLKGFYDIKAEIFSTPCMGGEKYIYVGSRDNFLYALEVQ